MRKLFKLLRIALISVAFIVFLNVHALWTLFTRPKAFREAALAAIGFDIAFVFAVLYVLILLSPVILALIGSGAIVWGITLLFSAFGRPWATAICVVGTLGMGFALFEFRKRWRVSYGIAEIAFACLVVIREIPPGQSVLSAGGKWAALFAAVYVIVRGCDNVQQGREAKAKLKVPDCGTLPLWPNAKDG